MDPITITFDFYPPAGSRPGTVTLAAGPQGGTPHLLSGTFAERHQLLDAAYGEAARRALKAEARKASKPAGKAKQKPARPKDESAESGAALEGDPADEFPDPPADQVGPLAPAALPVIEGDDAAAGPEAAEQEQLEFETEADDDGN